MPHAQDTVAPNTIAREEKAAADITQAIRSAFCGTIYASGLAPMAVLELAAVALGAIYREAVMAHAGPNGCPCGWQPEEDADIESLRTALAIGAIAATGLTLRTVRPLGRA